MEDQIGMPFSGVMNEAMNIRQAEEVVVAIASLSTRRSKRRRCYINRDREAAYFRLQHDYFDDDCVYLCYYFRRMYRMWMTLFLSIIHKLSEISLYFSERYDAIVVLA
jgi:hypothetical protein